MAGSFTPTGTISNLTRLELEQLRKADFTAGGKALTKGDAGQTVGVGDFNAEQFFTTPAIRLEDVSSMSPPSDPAASLGILIQDRSRVIGVSNRFTVRWYGPRLIHSGVFDNTIVTGYNSTTVSRNSNANNGEAPNDYIVIGTSDTSGGDQNTYLVGTIGTITSTVSTRRFSLTNIYNPFSSTPTNVEYSYENSYRYSVWRRDVVQLFAYPGSGPATGQEQTFLMVQADPQIQIKAGGAGSYTTTTITVPGADFTTGPTIAVGDVVNINNGTIITNITQVPPSGGLANNQLGVALPSSGSFTSYTISRSIHKFAGPTTDQINQVRVRNIIPPNYTSTSTKDRSDAIFAPVAPATRTNGADTLGYRVVLYPSVPNGTGPDFDKPITSLNPIIDPSIPSADQRFTIDYKAGIVRFSCAPSNVPNGAIQPDIKPVGGNGGCDLTTGRLNLYATFMAIDDSFTKRSSEALKASTQDSSGRPTAATITAGNINALGPSWDVFPGRVRLNNAAGATGTDPVLYEASGVLKTGRADGNETDANPPPVLEHRGQLLVGGGLVSGVTARTTPRIKHVVSTLSEGVEGRRTLRSETSKGTSGFAATREYAYDGGFDDYDMYEQTHNARWDPTTQLWVKDQGGGSYASRLYVSNSGLTFQTESSAASSFATDTTPLASGVSGTYTATYDNFYNVYLFSSITQIGFDFTPYVGKKFTILNGDDANTDVTINSVGPNNTIHFTPHVTNYNSTGPFTVSWNITNFVTWVPGPINVGAITATSAVINGTNILTALGQKPNLNGVSKLNFNSYIGATGSSNTPGGSFSPPVNFALAATGPSITMAGAATGFFVVTYRVWSTGDMDTRLNIFAPGGDQKTIRRVSNSTSDKVTTQIIGTTSTGSGDWFATIDARMPSGGTGSIQDFTWHWVIFNA